jgi:hypothetical protein
MRFVVYYIFSFRVQIESLEKSWVQISIRSWINITLHFLLYITSHIFLIQNSCLFRSKTVRKDREKWFGVFDDFCGRIFFFLCLWFQSDRNKVFLGMAGVVSNEYSLKDKKLKVFGAKQKKKKWFSHVCLLT